MTRLVDELHVILENDPEPWRTDQRMQQLETEALINFVKSERLTKGDAELLARLLVDKFVESNSVRPDSFLPRVGDSVGSSRDANGGIRQVMVTKIESKTSSKDQSTYWVVGLDFGGRGFKSKMVFPRRDGQYKVSWNAGKDNFPFEVVEGLGLRNELAKNVFGL